METPDKLKRTGASSSRMSMLVLQSNVELTDAVKEMRAHHQVWAGSNDTIIASTSRLPLAAKAKAPRRNARRRRLF